MKCPHCLDAVLNVQKKDGIEIDYCPNCKGVWLDRGELEMFQENQADSSPGPKVRIHETIHKNEYYKKDMNVKAMKKKSFFQELFRN